MLAPFAAPPGRGNGASVPCTAREGALAAREQLRHQRRGRIPHLRHLDSQLAIAVSAAAAHAGRCACRRGLGSVLIAGATQPDFELLLDARWIISRDPREAKSDSAACGSSAATPSASSASILSQSPPTLQGSHGGRPPRNMGLRYPADPPRVEEAIAVMRAARDRPHGRRLRSLIVIIVARGATHPRSARARRSRSESPPRRAARPSRQGRTPAEVRMGAWRRSTASPGTRSETADMPVSPSRGSESASPRRVRRPATAAMQAAA